ncbi:MAG: hypothetical protein ACPG1C_12325 [Alphaproteobacteria bacterium]
MFREVSTSDYDLPPLAADLVETIADLIADSPADLTLPLPLLHDLALTMVVDLIEESEARSGYFAKYVNEIPLLVPNGKHRSIAANRVLYLGQIASHSLCCAIEKRGGGQVPGSLA